jgi:hypothetical protein
MTPDERYIAVPVLACTMLMLWLWMVLWKSDGHVPFFDIGVLCAMATFLYVVFPLLNFWAQGLQFGLFSDSRLIHHNPSPSDIGIFHLRHVLYFFSLVISYVFFRKNAKCVEFKTVSCSSSRKKLIFLYFLFFTGFFFILEFFTGYSFNFSYLSESFESHLEASKRMPLLLLQISIKLREIWFLFKLSLLFIVISQCKQRRWRLILFSWIVFEIALNVYVKGQRTELILFLLACSLFYHRLVKPFRTRSILFSGMFIFLGFLFLGIYRTYAGLSDFHTDLSHHELSLLSANNEFQSLLGTTYDVFMMKKDGVKLPWYLYLNDFATILPPQQILPFKKIRASEWYLRQIGFSDSGRGFMWGVVSQSIVGLDWIELFLRGTILGYLLARLHRWYSKNQTGFLETLFYLYFCLRSYYTFRDTTLSPLSNLVWEIVPFYLLIRFRLIMLPRKKNHKTNRVHHFFTS